jgi:hypothetical protein
MKLCARWACPGRCSNHKADRWAGFLGNVCTPAVVLFQSVFGFACLIFLRLPIHNRWDGIAKMDSAFRNNLPMPRTVALPLFPSGVYMNNSTTG